jgi:hypothetical protein
MSLKDVVPRICPPEPGAAEDNIPLSMASIELAP